MAPGGRLPVEGRQILDLPANVGRTILVDRAVGEWVNGSIRDAPCGRSADANRGKQLDLAHDDQGVETERKDTLTQDELKAITSGLENDIEWPGGTTLGPNSP